VQYNVTKIQKIASKLVLFWDGTNLIRPITIIKEIDQKFGLIRLLADDGWFEFNIYPITEITDGTTTRTFTALSSVETSPEDYDVRLQDIYQFLVTHILRGCCCDDSNPESAPIFTPVQYAYSTTTPGTGNVNYNSGTGKLSLNLVSLLSQDFTDLFHHIPDGSWITIYSQDDHSVYTTFEVSNYALVGPNATWDVIIRAGATSFTNAARYNLDIDISGSGGSIQGLQDVITTDPVLTTDNSIDGGGFSIDWTNFDEFDIGVSGFFRALAGAGGYFSRVYVDPTTGSFDVSGTGTQSAKVSASNSGGVPNVTLRATDGVTETTEIILLEDGMFMVTPDVNSGTAVNGMSILLSDNTNGRIEFGTPSGIGTTATAPSDVADSSANVLKDLTGCSVPIVAGNTYYFMAFGSYDANSTAIGSRWTVNGPAATYLAYSSNYSLSATSATNNQGLSAYQLPSSNNSTSAATSGNTFKIEGIIIPSANGSLQVQFACESALGTITAKAGSFLKVIQL